MPVDFAALCSRLRAVESDLFRNIKGICESQDLFDDLTDDMEAAAVAMAAAGLGGGRGFEPRVSRAFEYGAAIGYSFDSANWQATRFGDGRRYGVWYGAFDLETTIYETAWHWRRFVLDSFADEDRVVTGERRVFLAGCSALLVDLAGKEAEHPGLSDGGDYGFCQAVGAYLWEQGQNGLVNRSVRRPAGEIVAVFRPERLSNIRDYCWLTYTMNPAHGEIVAERQSKTAPERWLIDFN